MKKLLVALTVAVLLMTGTAFAADDAALFDQAAAALLSPRDEAIQTHTYAMHPGESAFVPSIAPNITPFDEQGTNALSPGCMA